jgi:lactoylglutathione lyase
MQTSLTQGVDHVGLTVSDLAATRDFFVEALGWWLLGQNEKYPAAFVSDGHTKITLWRVSDMSDFVAFDRHKNIGLHHLALRLPTLDALNAVFEVVSKWPDVVVEFSPEPSGAGPKVHAMVREPSGNRIELSWDPR